MVYAVCPNCRHYRVRPQPVLFSSRELQSPKVLEAKLKGEEEENTRRSLEEQRFRQGLPFDYEPHYYPWCAACTPYDPDLFTTLINLMNSGEEQPQIKEVAQKSVELGQRLIQKAKNGDSDALEQLANERRAKFNPVTGEVMLLYTLCAYVNATAQCPLFEQKSK
jgi:hypothetical protein